MPKIKVYQFILPGYEYLFPPAHLFIKTGLFGWSWVMGYAVQVAEINGIL